MSITREYLRSHPNEVFVFGDNQIRQGHGGAAALRDEPNTYGFVTKKYPDNHPASFFLPREYAVVFDREVYLLQLEMDENPDKVYLISKVGAGLANRYGIFEQIIESRLKQVLEGWVNVRFLW